MAHLLVIDDEQSICWGLDQFIRQLGHTVATASSAEQGLRSAEAQRPDAVLLDVRLPGMSGIEAMPQLRSLLGDAPIVVMTAYGDLNTAVEAVRGGALEYLVKPFDLATVEQVVAQALRASTSEDRVQGGLAGHDVIIGRSPPMQEVYRQIALVAGTQTAVHLVGESGTGKELVARAIHEHSGRSAAPFVPVHIAALSEGLAESELFGHMPGAFTGAAQRRVGLLEMAHGGTVFLDEVAEIPASLQVKLLRALEQGEIWPVGSSTPMPVDFRIVSATHQDLRQLVASGTFRHDLFYRLMGCRIELPALRDRRDDIVELAEHLLAHYAAANRVPKSTLSNDAARELVSRPWHGNVRELRSALEHASLQTRGAVIEPRHLPPPMLAGEPAGSSIEEGLAAAVRRWTERELHSADPPENLHARLQQLVETPLFEAALAHCQGQYAAAARLLGVHRVTLRKKLDRGEEAE